MREGVLWAVLRNLWAVINQIRIWQCLFLHKICEIMTPYLCWSNVSKPPCTRHSVRMFWEASLWKPEVYLDLKKSQTNFMEDGAISAAAYTWRSRLSTSSERSQPLDVGGWEGLPGKASSYNISVPQVSHTCERTLGCWTSNPLNLRKCSFSVVSTFYKMHNFADLFLFLNEEALIRNACADSVFSVLICWLRITWAFVYSSGVE